MRLNPFLKQTLLMLFTVMAAIVGCRLTSGLFVWVIVLFGVGFALQGKAGWTIVCYMMLFFLQVLTPALIGRNAFFMMSARLGSVILVFAMLLQGSGMRRRHRIPIGWLWAYVVCAVLSSIGGWFPMISYLKLFNFAMLILGIQCIGRNMQQSDKDLEHVRAAMMAFAVLVLVGSFVARFVPSIGYSMELDAAMRYGKYMSADELLSLERVTLFSGIVVHSQALGPSVAFFATWLLCDMLFVERRFAKLHLALLAITPGLLWLTRSRTAFVIMAGSLLALCFVGLPRSGISATVKKRLEVAFTGIMGLLVVGLVLLQVTEGAVSKWLRKTDDVQADHRSLAQAVTDTRMGLVMRDLADFKRNPLFGKGFQVSAWHPAAYRAKTISIWSAPIEKGPLPVMILGEGGIVGAIAFILFLATFLAFCLKRRYVALLTLFTSAMASNLGETSFFSPSGIGGIGWIVFAVGGFCVDMISKRQSEHRFDMSVRWGDVPLDEQGRPILLPPPDVGA